MGGAGLLRRICVHVIHIVFQRTFYSKRALVVLAHQEKTSFSHAMKEAAVESLKKKGWEVTVSDLYAKKFSPVLSRDDILGDPEDPQNFKYSPESMKAWKEGRLSKDIMEEQKNLEAADLVIFQFPMYWFGLPAMLKGWFDRVLTQGFAYSMQNMYDDGNFKNKKALLSFSTGGLESMYTPTGINGDMNVILWPIHQGILHFCGFQVLEPQIVYSIAHTSPEKRSVILEAWQARLGKICEKPMSYLPNESFDLSFNSCFVLRQEVTEAQERCEHRRTVSQHMGKALPPDNPAKPGNTGL
uniref:NAD(P)H dehydrogenase [quinone] 1 n=1 Tax=Leptobrachium leishanense TaxID=445787 RepID=A0A8C5QXK9_9ANUR